MDRKEKLDKLHKLIGENISQLRKSGKQLTSQQKIADHLDMTRTSIVNIEAGRQKVSIFALWEIAELFEKDISDLLPTRQELNDYLTPPSIEDKIKGLHPDANVQEQILKIWQAVITQPEQSDE